MLGIGKKKAHGIGLIEKVAGRFAAMEVQIEYLNDRNNILDSSIERTATIPSNLHKLLDE